MARHFLRKVSIKGYRSIREVEVELGSLNVLIGANGAGKSNFVSFFKMLNGRGASPLSSFVGQFYEGLAKPVGGAG